MRRDPIRLLLDSVRDHGETVHLRMLNRDIVVVTDPAHLRWVFQENYRNYTKQTPGFNVLRSFLANGLLTNEGDAWLKQRRIAQPAFHRDRVAGFARTMTTAARAVADGWPTDGTHAIDVTADMMRLTLRVVGETLLSTDVTSTADRVGRALTVALRSANTAITRVVRLPGWFPTPGNVRLWRARATLDTVVYELIARRRRDPRDPGDLLSMLMHARDAETGAQMSDRQLRDEVMTIFLAGHETTAIALGWTWYLLARHDAVAHRLRAELALVLGGRLPEAADLPQLRYTEQVVKEAMRLFPPAWIISRLASARDRIGGYDIPAGTIIFASPYVTHRLERLWTKPWVFDPDRFDAAGEAARPPFAYLPFGGGPRQCIGNTFAMMELVLVVATIAQRYHLELLPGPPPRVRPAITLRPSAPIRMTARRISG